MRRILPPRRAKPPQYRIREKDELYLHGYGRDDGKGGHFIEWVMFADIYDLDDERDHSMQVGQEITVQQFNALMLNYDPYLRKNEVRTGDPVQTVEMLEWCRDNVTGIWPTWSLHIQQHRSGDWSPITSGIFFYFSRHQDAVQFKLTFA